MKMPVKKKFPHPAEVAKEGDEMSTSDSTDSLREKCWNFHLQVMRMIMQIHKLNEENRQMKAQNTRLKNKLKDRPVQCGNVESGENNAILTEMISNQRIADRHGKHARIWSTYFLSVAFVLYSTSAKNYRILKQLLPMPSISTLYRRFAPKLNFLKNNLTNYDGIRFLCDKWKEKDNIRRDLIVHAVLAFDAAVFKETIINENDCTNCIAFQILPIDPNISPLVIQLLPRPSGSLGENCPNNECKQIIEILSNCNVNVISVATDGDRSYLGYQTGLFPRYSALICEHEVKSGACLDRISSQLFRSNVPNQCFWWISDILHVLKCQRCRLKDELFIKIGVSFDSNSLKEVLMLKASLTKFKGATKMNDIYAVKLFSVESLVKLVSAGRIAEADYLMPFVLWYAVVAISDLSRPTRLSLLSIVFRIFVKWSLSRIDFYGQTIRNRVKWTKGEKKIKFAVIESDLVRYMNSVVFLYAVIKNYESVSLNRIGTHPLENYFGMIRLASHDNHSWDRFLSSAGKANIVSEILTACGIKKATRRDFTVGGTKARCQSNDSGKLDLPDVLRHSMNYLDECESLNIGSSKIDASLLLLEDLVSLSNWQENKHYIKLYSPGPVASDSTLSRIISFGPSSSGTETQSFFKWTPNKRDKARFLNENPGYNHEKIADEIGRGCTSADVTRFFEKLERTEQAKKQKQKLKDTL
jgi:regulator of replication initiation timing